MNAEETLDRSFAPQRIYAIGALLAVAAVLAFPLDLAVLEFMRQGTIRGDLRRAIEFSEVFAHGFGVAAILLTVVVLDPRRKRALPRMLACAFGAGIAVNLVKLVIGRLRPENLQFTTVWESFQGWIPAIRAGKLSLALESDIQSFPSGHAATAVGLAVALSCYYPRGRWLFAVFAALASLHRFAANAPMQSAPVGGAAHGWRGWGLGCGPARWGKWFDRKWEGK